VRSRCSAFPAVTPIDVVPSLSNHIEQLGTLRTLGTRLKRNDFGLGLTRGTDVEHWEHTAKAEHLRKPAAGFTV
jgi:hypothetical protein